MAVENGSLPAATPRTAERPSSTPSGHSLKPVDESVVEAVLSLRIDDLEPRLTRNGYDGWSADLKDELGAVLTRLACSGRVPPLRCPARSRGRLDRSLQTIRDWNTMMSKLGSIGVGAIILLCSTAVSASARGGGAGGASGGTTGQAGHAGAAGHGSAAGHGPPVGFVYDHTAPSGTFCQPGVCLKLAP